MSSNLTLSASIDFVLESVIVDFGYSYLHWLIKKEEVTVSSIGNESFCRLADLQVELLALLHSGHLSLNHLERFLRLSPEEREDRFGDWSLKLLAARERDTKYGLLADLGVLVVPDDYVHANRVTTFRKRFGGEPNFQRDGWISKITDENFSHPSRVLKPGDKIHVFAYRQIVGAKTSVNDRMQFLADKNHDLYLGVQGALLVYELKGKQLEKGYCYASYDKPENLWEEVTTRRKLFANIAPPPRLELANPHQHTSHLHNEEYGATDAFFGFCEEK